VTARVLIAVTHLLGIGHLARAALIAEALAVRGVATTLVSGGMTVPGLGVGGARLVALQGLRATDESFAHLVNAECRAADAALFAARRERLLALLAETAPHLVVVEQYPFGRRKLAAEFDALLVAARARGAVTVGSVRDVLQRTTPERAAAMAVVARDRLDAVLVHGDARVLPFEASFPAAGLIADRLVYTGYVAAAPAPREPAGPGHCEVLVSAGGGAVGAGLRRAALAAAALDPGRTWRVLTGTGTIPPDMGPAPPPNAVIEPNRPDFRSLLAHCAVSVSQGGYNTVADVLAARARAVVVPFSAGGQTEQATRAARLEALGLMHVIAEDDLGPARLAQAVAATAERTLPTLMVDIDGAQRSAALLKTWAETGHVDLGRAG